MNKRKYRAPVERRSHEDRHRALVGFSIRDDKGGWLNVKAGEEFTPPERMNVRQHIELGEIEVVDDPHERAQYEDCPEEVTDNG